MPNYGYLQSGDLDQRVELQSPVRTHNGQGGYDITWAVEDEVWAHVRPLRGRERNQSDRISAEGSYMVFIRAGGVADQVLENWRIRWVDRDRILNIRFIQDGGSRHLYLPLECDVGVAT